MPDKTGYDKYNKMSSGTPRAPKNRPGFKKESKKAPSKNPGKHY